MPSGVSRAGQGRRVLACQDLGRRHQGRLGAGLDGLQHGGERHQRLAAADIALEEAGHRRRGCEVGADLRDRALLAGGRRVGEGGQQPGAEMAVARPAAGPVRRTGAGG